MASDVRSEASGWAAHAEDERRARLALTAEERLAWLWEAKLFAADAAEAAAKRRNEVAPFNMALLGARSSPSAEAALRRQFERVRAMSARERVLLALELGEAVAPGDGDIHVR